MDKLKFVIVGGVLELVDISTTAGRAAYVAHVCRRWRRIICNK